MLAENLKALIEALVESEFRNDSGGLKIFRKFVAGPDKFANYDPPEHAVEPFQTPDMSKRGGRGRLDPNSHWTHPDHKAAIAKIQKR